MPATSAVRASWSTEMTPVSPETSRPLAVAFSRARNRFDVGFDSRTVAFGGMAR